MGDVYEAMNRSKREHGQEGNEAAGPGPDAGQPTHPHNGHGEHGALPIDEISAGTQSLAAEAQAAAQPADASPKRHAATLSAPPVQAKVIEHDHLSAQDEAQAEFDERENDDQPKVDVNAPRRTHVATKLNGYSGDVVVHHDRGSVIAEQYRAIRLQILSRGRNRKVRTHVITSSSPQEGKTVTTLNLGMTFAELNDCRTLLLECDLRRPSFYRQFHRECKPGLTNLLRGDEGVGLDDIVHPTVYDNLDFIPAGDRCTNSTEMLQSQRMAEVLEKLKGRYDHILVDSPPSIHVTDACILGSMCDDVLLVVRLNKTPVEVVDRAKRLLRAAHCDIAGVILTHQQFQIPNYLYQYV